MARLICDLKNREVQTPIVFGILVEFQMQYELKRCPIDQPSCLKSCQMVTDLFPFAKHRRVQNPSVDIRDRWKLK